MPARRKRPGKRPPIPVRAVDFVMYCAEDVNRLRRWYRGLSVMGVALGSLTAGLIVQRQARHASGPHDEPHLRLDMPSRIW